MVLFRSSLPPSCFDFGCADDSCFLVCHVSGSPMAFFSGSGCPLRVLILVVTIFVVFVFYGLQAPNDYFLDPAAPLGFDFGCADL